MYVQIDVLIQVILHNAVIFQNVDLTAIVRQLRREGYYINIEDLRAIALPSRSYQYNRFDYCLIDLKERPQALDGKLELDIA